MSNDLRELGQRLKGIREACDVTRHEMAEDLNVTVEQYAAYEETGADVPISVVYHIAHKFGLDMTEILTGVRGRLDTYQLIRKGEGRLVERSTGYTFEDLAWRYSNKIMQPLLVTLEPGSPAPADDVLSHDGQEFNMVLEGTMALTLDGHTITLNAGDSIYFNASLPHHQACAGDERTVFVTVIAE
ncbi:MAG: cupin domain-containing protein [Coriobacteriia bacterium]|nr:cupin domain-containing protein [Coriobacteriia bacterium]